MPVDFDAEALRYRAGSREAAFAIFNELGFRGLAKEYAPTADSIAKTYRVVDTVEGVRTLAAQLRASGRFAFRVLTEGPSAMQAAIVGFSFSTSPREGDYVPVGHRSLDSIDNVPLAAALDALRPVLEDGTVPKEGHDLKFDAIVLARHGVTLRGLELDTMLASYLLDATRSGHLIEDLALEHTNYKALSADDVCGRGAKAISLGEVPIDAAVVYACERADLVGQLAPTLKSLLASEALTDVYGTLELPLIPVLMAVERAGVRVDVAALAAQSQTVDRELAQRSAAIFGMAGGEFNINSPKQLAEVLFDKLQLPVLKRTGTSKAPSTAVEVLEELALSPRHPAADSRVAPADEAEGHLHRRAAPARESGNRPRAHVIQSGGGRDRTAEQQRSEPPEHSHPHGARTGNPAGVHRRSRQRPDFGRLLADRVQGARPSLGGAGAHRGISRRRRLPRAHGGEDLRR